MSKHIFYGQQTVFGGKSASQAMLRRSLIALVILIMVVVSDAVGIRPTRVLADQLPPTLGDSIAELERQANVLPNLSISLSQRLAIVETKVLGSAQNAPLIVRVQHLRQTLQPANRSVVESTNAPPSGFSATVPVPAPASLYEVSPGSVLGMDCLPLLNAVPANFLRMEPQLQSPVAAGDYIADALKGSRGKVMRYQSMPVFYYINAFPDRQFMNCVVNAFQVWEDRSNGLVHFVRVDDLHRDQARILVAWKRLGGGVDVSGCLLGAHTITKYTSRGNGSLALMSVSGVPIPVYIPRLGQKYTVPPQVIEVNLDLVMGKTPNVRYRLLQNLVSHEIGHALGLIGHSTSPLDIMYPTTDEHSRISQRDINTLIKLYKMKAQVPL